MYMRLTQREKEMADMFEQMSKDEQEIILEGCKKDGQVLYYASKELRDDKEVVLEAVKHKGIIVKYASKRLLEDTEVIIAALTQNKKAEIFIPIEFREKEEGSNYNVYNIRCSRRKRS